MTIQEETPRTRQRGPAAAFLLGGWLNRRFTRLSSSIVLSLAMGTALMIPIVSDGGSLSGRYGPVIALIALNTVFYPVAREGYYRATQPIREGLGGIWVAGILFLIAIVVKILVFLIVWAFAVPIGLLSWLCLGVQEATGRGWRIA